jgi:hypothetical protein
MSVTLTYDAVLARVQIHADSLELSTFALVERSTDQVNWTVVRRGIAVPVVLGSLLLPGVAGSYASTPDNAALDIPGDIDIRCDLTMTDWTPTLDKTLVAKYQNPSQRSYQFGLDATGMLRFRWSQDGVNTASVASTAPIPIASGRLAVRVTLDFTGGSNITLTFYTAPTMQGPWTVLGAPIVTTTSVLALFNSTSALEVGAHNLGVTEPLAARVHEVEVRNGINSTVVVNPRFHLQADEAASFTDGAGRVWTVNGDAKIASSEFVDPLYDYEYRPGVANFYRVRGFGPPGFVSVGAADHDVNAAVSPPIPFGTLGGDHMFLLAGCRNSGTGSVNPVTGWGSDQTNGNMRLFGRVAGGPVGQPTTDAAPTVTFAGTVAGVDTSAQIVTFRDLGVVPGTGWLVAGSQLNGAATDIAFGQLLVPKSSHLLALLVAWKQDDYTTIAAPAPWIEIAAFATALGDDQGMFWAWRPLVNSADLPGGSIVCTGSGSVISRSSVLVYVSAEFHNDQSSSIAPETYEIWLKSPARPFLNQPVTCVGFSDVERSDRGAEHEVVNRTLPIAVTEVGGSRRFALELYAASVDQAQVLDYALAAGDVLYVQTPAGCRVPGGYVRVRGSSQRRVSQRGASRVFTLPCVEVAAPGPDIGGAEGTWASVLAAYGGWAAVKAAFPTWADLKALIGDPSEVIVE